MNDKQIMSVYDGIRSYFIEAIEQAKSIIEIEDALLFEFSEGNENRVECNGEIIECHHYQNGRFQPADLFEEHEPSELLALSKPIMKFYINIEKHFCIVEYYFAKRYGKGMIFDIIVGDEIKLIKRKNSEWAS